MRASRTESRRAWPSAFIVILRGSATKDSAMKKSSELTRYSRNGGTYRIIRPCT